MLAWPRRCGDFLARRRRTFELKWKIVFFHHPLYSSAGTHGSQLKLRAALEPLFIQYTVSLVLNGHDHTYERIKPQNGIQYFVEGSSAKLRKGDINPTGLTAFGYDNGYTFMLVEIVGDELFFQTITDKAQTIDSGVAAPRNPAILALAPSKSSVASSPSV